MIKEKKHSSRKVRMWYRKGYGVGYRKGFTGYCGPVIFPQEKRIRTGVNGAEYAIGFSRGVYDGLKMRKPINSYIIEPYETGINTGEISEAAKTRPEMTVRDAAEVIDYFIDSSMVNALCHGRSETFRKGKAATDGDVKNGFLSEDDAKEVIEAYMENQASFIWMMQKHLKQFFLKLLLVEVTLLFDDRNEIVHPPLDDNYIFEILSGCNSKAPSGKSRDSFSKLFIDQYLLMTAGDAVKQLEMSKSTKWRMEKKLMQLVDLCRTMSLDEYALRLEQEQECDNLFREYFVRTFSIESYVSSDLIFMTLFKDFKALNTVLPINFWAYIGFIVQFLKGERNLFKHCETYKRKQNEAQDHNWGRDFGNIVSAYHEYVSAADNIMEYLETISGLLHAECVCTDFLINTHILHRKFFFSLDCELFRYLSDRFNIVEYTGEQKAVKKRLTVEDGAYYTALKYMRYFDIDMIDLSSCVFESETAYKCENLTEMTRFETISEDLNMPIGFLSDVLKEIYGVRGTILKEALAAFLGERDSVEKVLIDKLADLIIETGDETDDETDDDDDPKTDFIKTSTKNQSLLISHLIHLAAFDRIV